MGNSSFTASERQLLNFPAVNDVLDPSLFLVQFVVVDA